MDFETRPIVPSLNRSTCVAVKFPPASETEQKKSIKIGQHAMEMEISEWIGW